MSEPAPRRAKGKGPCAVLEGKALAHEIRAGLAERVRRFQAARGRVPGLAIIAPDGDPVVESYIRSKLKAAQTTGLTATVYRLPPDEAGALALLARLRRDDGVDGIILARPFPPGIGAARLSRAVAPEKDAEGLAPANYGATFLASSYDEAADGIVPCTPLAVTELLRWAGVRPAGKLAVVVGRSSILGKPVAHLLTTLDATVTLCHSKTSDLPGRLREADIVVACVGRPRFVQGDWLKPGAVVMDAGINAEPGGLCGDVDFAAAANVAAAVTPVPGGIGPVTAAILIANVVRLAERRAA